MVNIFTKKNIRKRVNNNKGFMSVFVLIGLAVFIPLILFVSIDLPYMMTMNRYIKNTLDNAAGTAITCIYEDKAADGDLQVNKLEAESMAKKVIQETFLLNDDLSVNSNSLIDDITNLEITVINNPEPDYIYTTPNGNYPINNTSVVIYAEIQVSAKFLKNFSPIIKHTGVSQVQFK